MLKRRKSPPTLWIVLGIIAVLVVGYFWYTNSRYQYFITTPVDAKNPTDVSFVVKKGDSVADIAKNLQDKNLILDSGAFKTYSKDNNIDRKVIVGRFMLNQTLTIPEVAERITNPNEGQLTLTIPEGTTIEGIDTKLVSLGVIEAGEFIQATKDFKDYDKFDFLDAEKMKKLPHPLEGYLFPDTYYIDVNHYSNEDMIDLMLKDFQKRLPDDAAAVAAQSKRSLYDVITMASIVEKEVRTEADRPMVAGILWKRLDSHWAIGADATLLYLKDNNTLDYNDLQADSPYNTRKNQGLPPGPICNPGLKAIEASLNPKDSDYFYYLTDSKTLETVYAKTNDEQNANKAKYIQ